MSVAVKPSGGIFRGGTTGSPSFPTAVGDAFIAQIDGVSAGRASSPDQSATTTAIEPSTPNRHFKRISYELSDVSPMFPFAISPDGMRLVYATRKGLFSRSMDGSAAGLIAGTGGRPGQPFFSPDGRWIGYWADQKLKKIAANGGTPITLYKLGGMFQVLGSYWGEDNSILFCLAGRGASNGIMRIPANGGTADILFGEESAKALFPQILPDGKTLLYSAPILLRNSGSGISLPEGSPKVVVRSLNSPQPRVIAEGFNAKYLATGHIIYKKFNTDGLYVIPFDAERLESRGAPVALVGGKITDYAISEAGAIAYMSFNLGSDIQRVNILLNCLEILKERVPVK